MQISADTLLGLINDILDFSKIEARKLDIETIDFDLGYALDETMRTLAPRAHQKGLELAYHVAPDVPAAVSGSSLRRTSRASLRSQCSQPVPTVTASGAPNRHRASTSTFCF